MNEYINKLSQSLNCDKNALLAIAGYLDDNHINIKNVEIDYDDDFKIRGKNEWIKLDVVDSSRIESMAIIDCMDGKIKDIIKEQAIEYKINQIKEDIYDYYDNIYDYFFDEVTIFVDDDIFHDAIENDINKMSDVKIKKLIEDFAPDDIIENFESDDFGNLIIDVNSLTSDVIDDLAWYFVYNTDYPNLESLIKNEHLIDDNKLRAFVEEKYSEKETIGEWLDSSKNKGYIVSCANTNDIKITFNEKTSLADRLAQSHNLNNITKSKNEVTKDKER